MRRPNPVDPAIGARLRDSRAASGVGVRELARRLDVSPSLLSLIETGKVQPSVRTLHAIVVELGLSLDEIFELTDGGVPEAGVGRALPVAAPATRGVRRSGEGRVLQLASGVRSERMAVWEDADIEFVIAVYGIGGSSSADGCTNCAARGASSASC